MAEIGHRVRSYVRGGGLGLVCNLRHCHGMHATARSADSTGGLLGRRETPSGPADNTLDTTVDIDLDKLDPT